jgi:hypothetical protein
MAYVHDDFEKAPSGEEVELADLASGTKGQHVDSYGKDKTVSSVTPARALEAPEFIRNMTPEERAKMEIRLKRKIDLRLMPMVILSTYFVFTFP